MIRVACWVAQVWLAAMLVVMVIGPFPGHRGAEIHSSWYRDATMEGK